MSFLFRALGSCSKLGELSSGALFQRSSIIWKMSFACIFSCGTGFARNNGSSSCEVRTNKHTRHTQGARHRARYVKVSSYLSIHLYVLISVYLCVCHGVQMHYASGSAPLQTTVLLQLQRSSGLSIESRQLVHEHGG